MHILMMMFSSGENWNNQDIDVKTRSIITVVALMASGNHRFFPEIPFAECQGSRRNPERNRSNHHTCWHFMQDGPKAGLYLTWQKKYGQVAEGDLPYEDEAMRAHAKEMVFPIGTAKRCICTVFHRKELSGTCIHRARLESLM